MTDFFGPPISVLDEPLELFTGWLAEARRLEQNDPEAMCLATAGADGQPSARMVLLKDFGPAGFTFYTNTLSHKGRQLEQNPKAALLFHWKSLRRQVRIEGEAGRVSTAESDAYFASRPREAQIGAWASQQSRPLAGRAELEQAIAAATGQYAGGPVSRPDYWSGYRVVPLLIEFWQEQAHRLHDRLSYQRRTPAEKWTHARLYP